MSSLTSRRSNRGTESEESWGVGQGGVLVVELTAVDGGGGRDGGGGGDLDGKNLRQEFELVGVGGGRYQLGSKDDHNMLMES